MTMLPRRNYCNLCNHDIQIVERNARHGSQSAVSCMPHTKVIVRFRWIQADGCDAFAVERDFNPVLQGYRLAVAVDQRRGLDLSLHAPGGGLAQLQSATPARSKISRTIFSLLCCCSYICRRC